MMPKMNGIELCKHLREDEKYNDTPIIFLTAKSEKEDLVEGFKLGAQDYIVKPYDADELLVRVSTQLHLKWKKQQLNEANEQLKELNAAKDLFFSIIAHDLKSPFFVLKTYSERLMNEVDAIGNKNAADMIKALYDASNQGRELLNNLLHWAMVANW